MPKTSYLWNTLPLGGHSSQDDEYPASGGVEKVRTSSWLVLSGEDGIVKGTITRHQVGFLKVIMCCNRSCMRLPMGGPVVHAE